MLFPWRKKNPKWDLFFKIVLIQAVYYTGYLLQGKARKLLYMYVICDVTKALLMD